MTSKKSIIALIPARSGSKRVKHKNIIKINGYPLIYYTINEAIKSKVFKKIYVITDSKQYAKIALNFGAEVLSLRPKKISGSNSTDYEWVKWFFDELEKNQIDFDIFSILRPTSPLRKASTIKRALNIFLESKADSLRAVERVKLHPLKMWIKEKNYIVPFKKHRNINSQPPHSVQFASLPEVFIQNASLEIAWKKTVSRYKNISGKNIVPFFTRGLEGFDINYIDDINKLRGILKIK